MAAITAFGRYVPERVLGNEELARTLGCEAEWILQASGIAVRRIAGPEETVVDLGVAAARDCLERGGGVVPAMILVASGSGGRRFPGPAAQVGQRLGFAGVPAIDLPLASAGSLFGMALGAQLVPVYGSVLVVAAERMSGPGGAAPVDRNVAILFGDGAGACLIERERGGLEIVDSALHSDGAFAEELRLEFEGPVRMNGLAVIRQAVQKLPAVIRELLERNQVSAGDVAGYVMHQANQNLIDRVARAIEAPAERFYSNIGRYGNTSSASLLIAAAEWREGASLQPGDTVCFAAFGAGFHWGAVLARQGQ